MEEDSLSKDDEEDIGTQKISLLEISPGGRILVAHIGNNIFIRVIN